MSSKFNLLHHRPDKCSKLPKIYMIFRTNLGPTAVDLIFFAPQSCKPWSLEDSTDKCIIVPTIALYYQQLHYITEKM